MKKTLFALGIFFGLIVSIGGIAYAANTYQVNLLPLTDDRYDLGSTTPQLRWHALHVGTATSTFDNGINLTTGGCFAVKGTCVGSGGGATPAGSNGQIQFNMNSALAATSSLRFSVTSDDISNGFPYGSLLIQAPSTTISATESVKGSFAEFDRGTASAGGQLYFQGGDALINTSTFLLNSFPAGGIEFDAGNSQASDFSGDFAAFGAFFTVHGGVANAPSGNLIGGGFTMRAGDAEASTTNTLNSNLFESGYFDLIGGSAYLNSGQTAGGSEIFLTRAYVNPDKTVTPSNLNVTAGSASGGALNSTGGSINLTGGSGVSGGFTGGDITLKTGSGNGGATAGLLQLSSTGNSTYADLSTANLSTNRLFSFPDEAGIFTLGSGSTGNCAQWSDANTVGATAAACGTVTSVATDATLTGGTITTTGTLGINLSNANMWSALQTFSTSPISAVFNNKVGIGTSTPWANLSVIGDLTSPLFVVATSTVGNASSTEPIFMIDQNEHEITGGGLPVVSNCGTSPQIVGNDSTMRLTTGSTGITECTITFARSWAPYPAPICSFDEQGSTATVTLTGSTTQTTLKMGLSASLTSATIGILCRSYFQ